jgi:hypothetical protein
VPSEKHSIYSIRHSFKDRLKAVEAPEELIDEMMGHRTDKPKYGDGYGLGLKFKYLQLIALRRGSRRVVIKASLCARHDVVGGTACCDLRFQPLEYWAVHRAIERHSIGNRSACSHQAFQHYFAVF